MTDESYAVWRPEQEEIPLWRIRLVNWITRALLTENWHSWRHPFHATIGGAAFMEIQESRGRRTEEKS